MRMPVNPSMAMRPFQFSALAAAVAVAVVAAEAAHQNTRTVHIVGQESGNALIYAGGVCAPCMQALCAQAVLEVPAHCSSMRHANKLVQDPLLAQRTPRWHCVHG